jgi:pimeloyl-ACP methyl ester carboxylesterase
MTAERVPDQRLRLADGRRLGFRVYGDPAGLSVLFLHGTPGSRLQMSLAHQACIDLRLALVAPDRWGYGLSEAPHEPSLRAFADDMAALMDHLGHAHFAVGGVSGGAPYAAAVGACLVSRVRAVALVSPVGPIAESGLAPSLPLPHRFNFVFLPRHPRIVATIFGFFRWSLVHAPWLAARLAAWESARIDKRLMTASEVSGPLLASFLEGLRPGSAGAMIDLSIFSRPWEIELAQIDAPARVWIGTKDRDVPIAAARALSRNIRGCAVTMLPEQGHLWVTTHHVTVLGWMSAVLRAEADTGT